MKKLLSVIVLLVLCFAARIASGEPFAYIADYDSDSVSIMNLATNEITSTAPVGDSPFGITINQENGKAYISSWNEGAVRVFDLTINSVTSTMPVGGKPGALAIRPAGDLLFVANYADNTLTTIDTTMGFTETVAVGTGPYGMAVTPDGARVFVANYGSNDVTVLNADTRAIVTTIPVGVNPAGVAINPTGTRAYVANESSNTVSVIDTATLTVTNTIAVGKTPIYVALNPLGTRAYVTNYDDDTVSVVNTATSKTIKTVAVPGRPYGVNVHPDGTKFYVTTEVSGTVTAINASNYKVIDTVPAGARCYTYGQFINPQYNFSVKVKGFGTVKSQNAPGIDCGSLCKFYFPIGKNITFKATAAKGSVFRSWLGACAGTKPTCTVAAEEGVVKGVGAAFISQPTASVSPTTKNFGKTKHGAHKKAVFTVRNKTTNGMQDLVMGTIVSDNPSLFEVLSGEDYCSGVTIDPNKSCKFTVQFYPAPGVQTGKITIPSNDPASPLEITVTGEGV